MTRSEFNEWMQSCPTHKWDVTHDTDDFVSVSFPLEDDEPDESKLYTVIYECKTTTRVDVIANSEAEAKEMLDDEKAMDVAKWASEHSDFKIVAVQEHES